MNHKRLAITLMLSQAVFFTIDTMAIHKLAMQVSFWQIGLLRAIGGFGLVAILATVGGPGRHVYKTVNKVIQICRVAVTVAYGWILVYSFSVIPFTDATAISYTTAIYISLLAPIILGEIMKTNRYFAVVIGMIGAMLIIKPGFSQLSISYVVVLLGTSLNALATIFSRQLQRQGEHVATVMLYVNLGLMVSFFPAFFEPLPDLSLWPWLIGACVTGPLGMYVGIIALKYAEASALAPYQYVRLVIATLGAILVFGETSDIITIVGIILITLACIINDFTFKRG